MEQRSTIIGRRTAAKVLSRWLAAVVVALPFVFAFGQQEPRSNEEKPLLFLAEENDPPLNYSEDGIVKGRDVDFAKALGEALGRSVRVELTTWEKARQAIEQGEADGFLTVANSGLRKEIFDVSDPVFRSNFGLFVRTGEVRIHGVDDLAGRSVGVIGTGSLSRQILSRRPEITLVTCANYVDAFGRLGSGQIDAVATEMWLAGYWIQQQPGRNFTIAGEPFASQPVGVGVRKGNVELLQKINRAIERLKSDGTIARIEEKWRPQEILFLSRGRVERTVFLAVGAFLAVLLLAMAFWVAALRRQRERLRLLAHALHSANDCIAISDPDDRILLVNDAFRRTYEYEDGEIIGQHASVLRAENNDPSIGDAILASTKEGGWRGELWNRAKDGRIFPISLVTSPLLNKRNQVVATVGVARDITGERQAADTLRSSQEKFAKLFQASPDCVVLSEVGNGLVIEVNERFEEITGYPRERILGRKASELGLFVDPCVPDQMTAELKAGRELRDFEYQLRRKSGEIATMLASVEVIEIGGTRYALGVHRDITRRKHLEEQLQQSQKMEAIGRLAAGIAHDFNNLLTIISGTCEMAMMDLPREDPLAASFTDVQSAAGRAASLTQQLLAFSRQQPIQPQVLDLNHALADLQNMLKRLLGENVLLHVAPGPELGSVKIDIGHLQQVVLNLVVNARDAMPSGGKLLLETMNTNVGQMAGHPEMPPGEYVVLAVTDTGSGMNAETQARLFEPFFTTKELGKGTGLGLATVYGIVKQNGGFIWVYSEVGVGTTFKIYFPRVDEKVAVADRKPTPAAESHVHETVLLAEDEEALRHLLSKHLASIGYHVIAAKDGNEALAKCNQERIEPGLLITDVGMPGMSGRELAETLSRRLPGLKVLYLSGYTDETVLRHGILPAGSYFLQKPFTLQVFTRKVRELVAG